MADENIPQKASDGLDRLLFGPVYLVSEVISSVLPGLLSLLLFLLNKNNLAQSLFQLGTIGYRTKIFLILFIAYIVGKALAIPHGIVAPLVWQKLLPFEVETKKKKKKDPPELLSYFAAGAIALPTFFGPSRVLDHIVLAQAMLVFNSSCGLAFVISGVFTSDLAMRTIEFAVGTCFLIASVLGQKPFVGLVAAAAAHSLAEFAFRIPLANWPIVLKVIQAVAVSQKTPDKVDTKVTAQAAKTPPQTSVAGT